MQSVRTVKSRVTPKNKHELAAILISRALANGPVESTEIHRVMANYSIGEKTMNDAKVALGIKPYRKMRRWYWAMPEKGGSHE